MRKQNKMNEEKKNKKHLMKCTDFNALNLNYERLVNSIQTINKKNKHIHKFIRHNIYV